MADKPCRWVHGHDPDDILCTHPLGRHWCPEGLGLGMPILDTTCHGCPCHEPQTDPNGSIRPESDETAPVRVHDKP